MQWCFSAIFVTVCKFAHLEIQYCHFVSTFQMWDSMIPPLPLIKSCCWRVNVLKTGRKLFFLKTLVCAGLRERETATKLLVRT